MARENKINLSGKISLYRAASFLFPPIAVTVILYLLTPNGVTTVQATLAFTLLQYSWFGYLRWKRQPEVKLPILVVISLMYWIYYSLALFLGARTVSGVDTAHERLVSEDSITWSLALANVGVAAMAIGMALGHSRSVPKLSLPQLKDGPGSILYIRLWVVLGVVLAVPENLPYAFGEGSRQLMTIIISLVPVLAFALLFRRVVRREGTPLDLVLVLGFLCFRFIFGLSSGWLGAFASLILVCAAVYVSEKRKVPRLAFVLVILFTLFFQVGKQEFRKVYWRDGRQTTKIDRVAFWTETSFKKWEEAWSDQSGESLTYALNSSLSRVSLLTQTANVIELTPSAIPYQGMRLYSYLALTWIPRAIWPDKPSINEANQFYQIAYGLSTEEGAENVSIGVGVMTESYISFGWGGAVVIMSLMGLFYSVYQRVFFETRSGVLMTALGIALLPQMISIESQMAAYLGGIVQQVGFTVVVFAPIVRWRAQRPHLTPRTDRLVPRTIHARE